MSVGIRFMREGQEDAVAAMLRALPKDLGKAVVPKVTGASLRENRGFVHVTVAEDSGLLLGVCLWVMTYSSWRGAKGIYISDLYVMGHARGRKVGEKLLRGTLKEAAKLGGSFVKMEVDRANDAATRFYGRLGFVAKVDDVFHVLEPDDFEHFLKGEMK
jgi:ribosomal protein S18 acetylase RimI-like enzyme